MKCSPEVGCDTAVQIRIYTKGTGHGTAVQYETQGTVRRTVRHTGNGTVLQYETQGTARPYSTGYKPRVRSTDEAGKGTRT